MLYATYILYVDHIFRCQHFFQFSEAFILLLSPEAEGIGVRVEELINVRKHLDIRTISKGEMLKKSDEYSISSEIFAK